jgi:hypothetical protein
VSFLLHLFLAAPLTSYLFVLLSQGGEAEMAEGHANGRQDIDPPEENEENNKQDIGPPEENEENNKQDIGPPDENEENDKQDNGPPVRLIGRRIGIYLAAPLTF